MGETETESMKGKCQVRSHGEAYYCQCSLCSGVSGNASTQALGTQGTPGSVRKCPGGLGHHRPMVVQ